MLIVLGYNSLNRQHKDLYCLIRDVLNISLNLNSNFSFSLKNSDLFHTFKYTPGEHSRNFCRNRVIDCLRIYYLFTTLRTSLPVYWVKRYGLSPGDRRFILTDAVLLFFFLDFLRMFLTFLREAPGFCK